MSSLATLSLNCDALPIASAMFQACTALIATGIAVITYRYTRRQNALMLINNNNTLANLVNSAVIDSKPARDVLGRLQDPIVGRPDDAVLFLYLNYVHNTYRVHQAGAISRQVWQDTLASCTRMMARLDRDQVTCLLARGYEVGFQKAVIERFDAAATTSGRHAGSAVPARSTRLRFAA